MDDCDWLWVVKRTKKACHKACPLYFCISEQYASFVQQKFSFPIKILNLVHISMQDWEKGQGLTFSVRLIFWWLSKIGTTHHHSNKPWLRILLPSLSIYLFSHSLLFSCLFFTLSYNNHQVLTPVGQVSPTKACIVWNPATSCHGMNCRPPALLFIVAIKRALCRAWHSDNHPLVVWFLTMAQELWGSCPSQWANSVQTDQNWCKRLKP